MEGPPAAAVARLAARTGVRTSSPAAEATMSKVRLSVVTLREKRIGGRLTTGTPSMSSIAALDANSSK